MNSNDTSSSYPSIKQSFGLLGFIIFFTILVSIAAVIISMVVSSPMERTTGQSLLTNSWTSLFLYTLPFLLTLWWAISHKKRHEPDYSYPLKSVSPAQIGLIIISTLCIYFMLDPLIELLPMPDFLENMFKELLSRRNLPTFLMLVIAAPVLEEMLCRGIILDGFLKRYSSSKAIIWSAVLFGLMHLNPWQFISAFGLGLYMGWLYNLTGSLLSTMLVHAVANGFSFLVGFIYPHELKSTQDIVGNNWAYAGILLICIFLLYSSMRLTRILQNVDR